MKNSAVMRTSVESIDQNTISPSLLRNSEKQRKKVINLLPQYFKYFKYSETGDDQGT